MKTRSTSKFKVTPVNIRNGNTAPYFILIPESNMRKDEVEVLATKTFRSNSGLGKYENWQVSVEKI